MLVDEEYEERFLNETMQRDGNENDTDDKELHSQTRRLRNMERETRYCGGTLRNEKSVFFECCCFWCAAMEKKDKS